MKNKRGSIEGILWVTGGIIILLFLAVMFAIGGAIINFVGDTLVPEFDNLGMVGDWNASQTSELVIHPINNVVQNMQYFGVVVYVFGILALFGLAFAYRFTNQKWLIPLFIMLMIIVVIICIFISNIYEEFYTGTDDVSTRLQEQSGLSYLILYSPMIMTVIGFIAGAILFSSPGVIE